LATVAKHESRKSPAAVNGRLLIVIIETSKPDVEVHRVNGAKMTELIPDRDGETVIQSIRFAKHWDVFASNPLPILANNPRQTMHDNTPAGLREAFILKRAAVCQ
jgi:hypothetical protein